MFIKVFYITTIQFKEVWTSATFFLQIDKRFYNSPMNACVYLMQEPLIAQEQLKRTRTTDVNGR